MKNRRKIHFLQRRNNLRSLISPQTFLERKIGVLQTMYFPKQKKRKILALISSHKTKKVQMLISRNFQRTINLKRLLLSQSHLKPRKMILSKQISCGITNLSRLNQQTSHKLKVLDHLSNNKRLYQTQNYLKKDLANFLQRFK